MKAFINNGYNENALSLYQNTLDGLKDDTLHLLGIKAALNMNDFQFTQQIIDSLHIDLDNICALYCKRQLLMNTIMDFYGQTGNIKTVLKMFDNIPMETRDIVTVTIMMNAFCENGMNEKCIELFKCMNVFSDNGLKANDIMLAVVLKACIHETDLDLGMKIHEYVKQNKEDNILNSLDVLNNLMCLYGKGNKLNLCEEIFDEIKMMKYERYLNEIKLWNNMINAYVRNG
eukprot:490035_1